NNITFHINKCSMDYWFSISIEYEDIDGDVGAVHQKEAESEAWIEMKHLLGANRNPANYGNILSA
ncbi:hypothetical protein KI387_029175, partial [Taxus chinensis]